MRVTRNGIALAGLMEKFHYLRIGLAVVLAFVGAKMLLADLYEIPIAIALSVIAILLAAAVAASLIHPASGGRPTSASEHLRSP